MREAGFERGGDGFFSSPGQGRFSVEVKTTSAQESQNELAAMADNWRQNGFDIVQTLVPNALFQDLSVRAGYPGLFILSVPINERFPVSFLPDSIPTAENGWRGSNRSGWTNPAYTELIGQFMSTLEFSQREEQLAQMARIFTEDAPTISLSFRPIVWTYVSELRGPTPVPPETNPIWNIHEWEWVK
jgi:ABC-type transport system substrate-binding protein